MFTNPVSVRRFECTVILLSCFYAYHTLGFSWLMFLALFFIPDLTLLVYVIGKKIGGIAYNTAHCFVWPVALGMYSWQTGDTAIQAVAIIWLAHCAFDRAIGWGLKYPDSFCNTDMGVKTLPVDNEYLR